MSLYIPKLFGYILCTAMGKSAPAVTTTITILLLLLLHHFSSYFLILLTWMGTMWGLEH